MEWAVAGPMALTPGFAALLPGDTEHCTCGGARQAPETSWQCRGSYVLGFRAVGVAVQEDVLLALTMDFTLMGETR